MQRCNGYVKVFVWFSRLPLVVGTDTTFLCAIERRLNVVIVSSV